MVIIEKCKTNESALKQVYIPNESYGSSMFVYSALQTGGALH